MDESPANGESLTFVSTTTGGVLHNLTRTNLKIKKTSNQIDCEYHSSYRRMPVSSENNCLLDAGTSPA
jgi:hypothetical protein